ncbi:hypothetical protein [Geothermobacter hydrogeniphilus]|uniref:hypothetical protein n=1 Tax=Geothermobacter hydrogeniphilus TaxID=1969733 RepID=UPI00111C6B47|nr:hypothetical protein [Geothermobacter hydrogeniphilus]
MLDAEADRLATPRNTSVMKPEPDTISPAFTAPSATHLPTQCSIAEQIDEPKIRATLSALCRQTDKQALCTIFFDVGTARGCVDQ